MNVRASSPLSQDPTHLPKLSNDAFLTASSQLLDQDIDRQPSSSSLTRYGHGLPVWEKGVYDPMQMRLEMERRLLGFGKPVRAFFERLNEELEKIEAFYIGMSFLILGPMRGERGEGMVLNGGILD